MEEHRKYLLDKFQHHLFTSYSAYCKMHELPTDHMGFITYLIDQELIPKSVVKRYTILKEFDDSHSKGDQNKTKTVNTIANRFNISTRTVWSILRNGKEFRERMQRID